MKIEISDDSVDDIFFAELKYLSQQDPLEHTHPEDIASWALIQHPAEVLLDLLLP